MSSTSMGRGGGVPADWIKAIIVPVYKGKGRNGECGSYRGISLLSIPKKIYGKIITERVQRLTEEKISEEQGGFRKGRGCVDQILSFRLVEEKILARGKNYTLPSLIYKMVVEKILARGKKLYTAFIDIENGSRENISKRKNYTLPSQI